MNWSREFGRTEIWFTIIFIIIYVIYFFRIWYISRKLKTSANASIIKFILRGLYMGFLILGLLGPSFGVSENEARATSKDIYLAYDLSLSMNASDVAPSRIDKSKNETMLLLNNFQSNRIGIILFNTIAQIYSPLTFDQETLRSQIQQIKTSKLPASGTDFNVLFELLIEKFQKQSNHIKAAIIMTDGENFNAINEEYLRKIKELNINIIFLAVGTSAGSPIPTSAGFKKDKIGENVITNLDVKQVASIINKTGGAYFVLNNEQNQLKDLVQFINKLTISDKNLQKSIIYNKYIYFLIPALLLIIIDFLSTVNVMKL